ncbi:MAG: DUF6173 family protein [Bryobacteraceae bacterium]
MGDTRKSILDLVPDFSVPALPGARNALIEATEANYASEFYKRLVQWISEYDAALDQAHEVGLRLVNFGQTVVFHLTGLGFWNPSLIRFSGGMEDGSPVELIQHVSQISVLLLTLARKDPAKPKRPIGFAPEEAVERADEKGGQPGNAR